ncbi:MAG: alpha-amylase, partial [Deltaproteobacteria bacterium]|nr:alpha-amylase [Deltaproteobacteria bacterium]
MDELISSARDEGSFSGIYVVRLLVRRLNETRGAAVYPENALRPGYLYAVGIVQEVLRAVLRLYREERNPQAFRLAMRRLTRRLGRESVERTLSNFVRLFPPPEVYHGEQSVDQYLERETAGTPNALVALEEMVLLSLSNENPAFSPFEEFFDDGELRSNTDYLAILESIDGFFKTQPFFGPENKSATDILKVPMRVAPESLTDQLLYIKDHWGSLLSGDLMIRILLALDLIREEEKVRLPAPGPAGVPRFEPETGLYDEPERFSKDLDWMPRVVLIAKSAYVWLDQLSKKYGRQISRL